MANGDTQNNIAADTAASYDRPIAVSVINKLEKFPFMQELAYNGILGFLKQGFLGLQDFFEEMTVYSSVSTLLKAAWSLIVHRAPLNLDVERNLYTTESLGTVGLAFQRMIGYDQVFAVDPDDLQDATGSSVVSANLPSA